MPNESGTKENPWKLRTPPGTSDYEMYKDEKDGREILVCTVRKAVLYYDYRAVADLHKMLKAYGDWMKLGSADEQKPAKEGTIEAWTLSKKSNWRLVWPEERASWSIRDVCSTIDGKTWTCGT